MFSLVPESWSFLCYYALGHMATESASSQAILLVIGGTFPSSVTTDQQLYRPQLLLILLNDHLTSQWWPCPYYLLFTMSCISRIAIISKTSTKCSSRSSSFPPIFFCVMHSLLPFHPTISDCSWNMVFSRLLFLDIFNFNSSSATLLKVPNPSYPTDWYISNPNMTPGNEATCSNIRKLSPKQMHYFPHFLSCWFFYLHSLLNCYSIVYLKSHRYIVRSSASLTPHI